MPNNRIVAIDFLRGLAILLVLLTHHYYTPPFLKLMSWIGVDLFFVISGFLIGGLLFQEYLQNQKIDLKRFLIRRGFKIYPMFYMLALVTIFIYLYKNQAISRRNILGELVFLQNYLGFVNTHTWSLAVEEHFYLLLPLLLIFLSQNNTRQSGDFFHKIPVIFVFIATICLIMRVLTFILIPYDVFIHHCRTHLRIDSLFFGVLLAYYYYFRYNSLKKQVEKNKAMLLVFSIAFISPSLLANYDNFYINTFGLSMFYIGFGGLLLFFVFAVEMEKLPSFLKVFMLGFIFLGQYSYGIYLWHWVVYNYLEFFLLNTIQVPALSITHFSGYLLGSILIGVITTKIIEKPALQLREKLFPALANQS
ncbi:MAG: acyltransferase [Microscillaceae bacterium]|jgi:peptidoglycan/LPS O-acetylase OafA/YrhL|nr:acyltransferase [Microscillaceae bacterium]